MKIRDRQTASAVKNNERSWIVSSGFSVSRNLRSALMTLNLTSGWLQKQPNSKTCATKHKWTVWTSSNFFQSHKLCGKNKFCYCKSFHQLIECWEEKRAKTHEKIETTLRIRSNELGWDASRRVVGCARGNFSWDLFRIPMHFDFDLRFYFRKFISRRANVAKGIMTDDHWKLWVFWFPSETEIENAMIAASELKLFNERTI